MGLSNMQVRVIELGVTYCHRDGSMAHRDVECHFWMWCGESGDCIDCYEVQQGRLVKVRGFCNVSEVSEVVESPA